MIRTTILVITVTALAASAAAAKTWEKAEARIAACFAAMDRDPALGVVNARFARREPTPAQLADETFATAAESDALRLRVQKTRPCRAARLEAIAAYRPLLDPSYRTLYYQADQVFQYLTEGWIAYGLANRLAHESLTAFLAREQAYNTAHSDADRRALSNGWDEHLQRAHSNPPPDGRRTKCEWQALNIACDR